MIKTEINTPSVQVGFDAFSYFRDLAKRNKLCSEVVVQPVLPSIVDSVKHECQYGAKYLEEKELEDLLS